jgi:Formylmethanofuran dehydrogenase subunit E
MEGDNSLEVTEFIKKRKAEKTKQILNAKKEEILKISYPVVEPPKQARIFKSLRCENCGEKVAEVKARLLNGKTLCIPCFGYRARIRNHGHSCFLCEIVIRSQFHTTYEPEA